MKNYKPEKAKVLAIQTGPDRYVRASVEDLHRYAGYIQMKPPYSLLTVAKRLTKTLDTPIRLVRYFDTVQYEREQSYFQTMEEEAGVL